MARPRRRPSSPLCRQLAADRGLTYQPSYDDMPLMEGHATMGLEVVEELQEFDCREARRLAVAAMLGGLVCSPCRLAYTQMPRSLVLEPEGAHRDASQLR